MSIWKKCRKILIVDEDNTQTGPIAEFLLRNATKDSNNQFVRGISIKAMGLKRKKNELNNRAISYLQQSDIRVYDVYPVSVITPSIAKTYDVILCMNDYVLRKVKFGILFESLEVKENVIRLFSESVGLSGDISDPGDDYNKFYKEVDKIPPIVQKIVKELEKNN